MPVKGALMANPRPRDANDFLEGWVTWLAYAVIALAAAFAAYIGISLQKPEDGWAVFAFEFGAGVFSSVVFAGFAYLLVRPALRRRDVQDRATAQRLEELGRFVELNTHTKVINEAGMDIAFPSRAAAGKALRAAIAAPGNTEIRIMGTSLPDTSRGSVRKTLEEMLPLRERPIMVRILLGDPRTVGGWLGKVDRTAPGGPSYLPTDLVAFLEELQRLRRRVKRSGSDPEQPISVEVRLTRVLPPSFLVLTDSEAFVQPYFIRAKQAHELPVLHYLASAPLRTALIEHFDVLWAQSSAPVGDPVGAIIHHKPVRLDEAAAATGLVQLYHRGDEVLDHMSHLLESAQRRVWMQGISNAPIMGQRLTKAFRVAALKAKVDVRVLILDPASSTARKKTFARYENHRVKDWETYSDPDNQASENLHNRSDITRNIVRAIDWFTDLADERQRMRDTDNDVDAPPMQVRLCDSVEAFILIIDDQLIVEPYHYGDETNIMWPNETQMQLADNMPLMEFHQRSAAPFPPDEQRLKPLRIYEAHFKRVFDHFSVPVGGTRP
jgi:hypothetical protein